MTFYRYDVITSFRCFRYLVTTLSRYYVYFLHDAFCLLENVDDLLVVFHILKTED